METCDGDNNKADFHIDNMKTNVMEASTNAKEKASEIKNKHKIIVDVIRKLSAPLRDSRVQTHDNSNNNKLMITN